MAVARRCTAYFELAAFRAVIALEKHRYRFNEIRQL